LTAKEWAEMLASPHPVARHEAATALGAMDHEGFPHLLQGMKSKSPELRLASLQGVYKPILVQNKDSAMPLVTQMLRDEDSQVRLNAVYRICWFEASARHALPTLQYLAANDSNPEIRDAARLSTIVINYHITGKPPAHGSIHPP
jgi:HEAT repeat protein